MSDFTGSLAADLDAIRAAGLWRELRRVEDSTGTELSVAGRSLVQFASNDYLGLARHPGVVAAAVEAAGRWGAGSTASRLIAGSLAVHHDLEAALADWKGTEAALAFSSGYAAAAGVIPAVVESGDVVIVDRLVHACCVDAARQSGARLRVFDHNDPADLEEKLRWARGPGGGPARRVLIVTESVFSMDGDLAPLRDIVELKDRYGAWLMLDEAHAAGMFGEGRAGLAEACGVASRVEIQLGTLGKALGSAGGYVCGPRVLIDLLVNRARTFIFSTAPVPAAAAAALAAVQIVRSAEGEQRRQELWSRVDLAKNTLVRSGWPPGLVQSAILPLVVGAEAAAVELARALREVGYFIPAIRFPTVARGAARLRLTVSAAHTPEQILGLGAALQHLRPADASTSPDASSL